MTNKTKYLINRAVLTTVMISLMMGMILSSMVSVNASTGVSGNIQEATYDGVKTDLIAWYKFDGDFKDYSGKENHATNYGSTFVSGMYGQAVSFDGDDYIDTPVDSNILPLSFEVLFKTGSDISGEQSIIDSDVSGRYGHSIILGYWNGDGTLDIQYHNGEIDTGHKVKPDTWYYMVVEYSDKIRVYLNGEVVKEQEYDQDNFDGSNFRFGRHNSGDPQWFKGSIDWVKIYRGKAPSKEQIIKDKDEVFTNASRDDGKCITVADCGGLNRHCEGNILVQNVCKTDGTCGVDNRDCSNSYYNNGPALCQDGACVRQLGEYPTTIKRCEGDRTYMYIEDRKMENGKEVKIPVMMCNAKDLANMDFHFSYDPEVLRFKDAEKGSLNSNFLFESNEISSGNIKISFASSAGVSGSGSIAILVFDVAGSGGDSTTLTGNVNTASISSGSPVGITISPGVFTVGSSVPGDCDGDGLVNSRDALAALQMSVGKIKVDLCYDVTKDGKVDSADAREILKKAVKKG